MMSNLFLLVTALAVVSSSVDVSAFTTTPMIPSTMSSSTRPLLLRSPVGQRPMRKADLFSTTTTTTTKSQQQLASSAASANNDSGADTITPNVSNKILQQLEREEAKMNKQRQKAMEKLNQVEQSLNQLQSKKQEYLNGDSLAQNPPGGNFSETTTRSAVKALLWRLIAGSITFITSLRFSGSVTTALSIVGSDFFSKAFTMFIGERLMNKSQAGRKSGADGAGRSLAKALIWRLFAIANTLTMAIFISKDLSVASKIASTDAVFKTALMFFYERAWAKIEWGKEYQVEYNL